MNEEIEKLKQQIAELQRQLAYTDDYATGLWHALAVVLVPMLKDHPNIEQVQQALMRERERYQAKQHDPSDEGFPAAGYEPAARLYGLLGTFGVWPGLAPHQHAEQMLEDVLKPRDK